MKHSSNGPRWVEYEPYWPTPPPWRLNISARHVTPLESPRFVRSLHQQSVIALLRMSSFSCTDSTIPLRMTAGVQQQIAYDWTLTARRCSTAGPRVNATAYSHRESAVGISGRRLPILWKRRRPIGRRQRIHLIATAWESCADRSAVRRICQAVRGQPPAHFRPDCLHGAGCGFRDYFTDSIHQTNQ